MYLGRNYIGIERETTQFFSAMNMLYNEWQQDVRNAATKCDSESDINNSISSEMLCVHQVWLASVETERSADARTKSERQGQRSNKSGEKKPRLRLAMMNEFLNWRTNIRTWVPSVKEYARTLARVGNSNYLSSGYLTLGCTLLLISIIPGRPISSKTARHKWLVLIIILMVSVPEL